MLLQAKHLKKTYYTRNGALEILKNVSLDVKENEVIMIGGPSGSGKTTLFQILSGLDNEYEGEIMLEENRYHDMKKRDRRKLRLQKFSYIFQDYCLMPTLNVYDNVIFQALAAKKKRRILWRNYYKSWEFGRGENITLVSCQEESSSGWRLPGRW